MGNELFRKKALEELSTPEQIDSLVKQVSPKGWLALATFGLVIVFALIWGYFGTITTKVQGSGLIMNTSGISKIYSTTNGMISDLYINVGDEVSEGQIIASVIRTNQDIEIQTKERALLKLKDEYEQLFRRTKYDLELKFLNVLKDKDEIKHKIDLLKIKIDGLQATIRDLEDLYKDGLVTEKELIDKKHRLEELRIEVIDLKRTLTEKNIMAFNYKREREDKLNNFVQKVIDAKREIKMMKRKLDEVSHIESKFSGRIVDLEISKGSVINSGTTLAVVENSKSTNDLRAVFFVPATQGKKIKDGMVAQVSPSNVLKEEYGFVIGEVDYVSEFPASKESIMNIINNEVLVNSYLQAGPPIVVYATLLKDSETASGLKWSSKKGPPVSISSGTICEAQVAVKKEAPINLVIPYIKKKLGL